MKYAHTSSLVVNFSDTDMAGLVHFTNFFKYAERAEADFFEAVGIPLIERNQERSVGWPRVRVDCKFSAPLYFRDRVEVVIAIKALKIRAIDWAFAVYVDRSGERVRAAKGSFSTVHVRALPETGGLESMAIPEALMAKVAEAPAVFLADL